ncbi:MAG: hypothetical protein FWF69_01425, partial [Firmicutes bacterium]|nr:hypothetical protein [Bacillota bacterium]
MSLFFVALILLAIGVFVIPAMKSLFSQGKRRGMFTLARLLCFLFALLVGASAFVAYVAPGRITRIYTVGGGGRVLTTGYNFTAPWNKKSTWDTTLQKFVFVELGVESDPNDAFGGQTMDGDYLTTVANLSVRINPERLDEYIEIFGEKNIGSDLGAMMKGVLKAAFEQCLEAYHTENVMPNKSKIVGQAREIAIARLEDEFPILVGELIYPDIIASAAYEDAIKRKAQLRMETEQLMLEAARNTQAAEANRIEAEGEAEVVRINAEAQAKAVQEAAKGEAAASEARAKAAAEVLRINSEAQATAAEEKARGESAAIALMAAAEADALLARTKAEADGYRELGTAYADFPHLMQLKSLENENALIHQWNGVYIPSLGAGAGNTVGFANYTELFERLFALAFGGAGGEAAPAGVT